MAQSALEQKRAVEQSLASRRQVLPCTKRRNARRCRARTLKLRLSEKETALEELRRKLETAESVEAAFKQLESLRKQLGELDALSSDFTRLRTANATSIITSHWNARNCWLTSSTWKKKNKRWNTNPPRTPPEKRSWSSCMPKSLCWKSK